MCPTCRTYNYNDIYAEKVNIIIIPTVGYFAWISHIIVGLIIDLYDMGPSKKIGMADWALITFVPSFIAVVFLNFKKTNNLLVSHWFGQCCPH